MQCESDFINSSTQRPTTTSSQSLCLQINIKQIFFEIFIIKYQTDPLTHILIYIIYSGLISAARKQNQRPKETAKDPETSEQCPEPYGYFADAEQCDKYYECIEGEITEKLCPDGMVFNDFSSEYEKCDLPYNIDCTQRPKLRKCFALIIPFY